MTRSTAKPDAVSRRRTAASRRESIGHYGVVIGREASEYVARIQEFPGIIVRAATPNQCEVKARAAIAVAIRVLREEGLAVPTPIRERRKQVNFRLSEDELEAARLAASKSGFKSVSDFARAAILAATRAPSRRRAQP
jgi:predicted RNase H-like HicB family nuclease